MINTQLKQTIETLYQRQIGIRAISRQLGLSRNTVRKALSGGHKQADTTSRNLDHLSLIRCLYARCKGNVVRIKQILADEHGIDMAYSSLTMMVRNHLREPQKKQSGTYVFEPGQEMQHDTSSYLMKLADKDIRMQCAGLITGYSRMAYIQFYQQFTRFEAMVFLADAFQYIGGTCSRCTIDNTSVLVADGTGPDAIIAEKIRQFGVHFGATFIPHAVGHADRKAHVERLFSYVEKNFLPARTFTDLADLNRQAKQWCDQVANAKPKQSLNMSPAQALIMERAFLTPLPDYIPPIYQSEYRVVDIYGDVHLDTNRYSVPYRFISKKVEVQKHIDTVIVYEGNRQIATHPRVVDARNRRVSNPAHRSDHLTHIRKPQLNREEMLLTGKDETLDQYVAALKKRGRFRVLFKKLLDLKRTYPEQAFSHAIDRALGFGMYDLNRLESLIITFAAGRLFNL